MITDLFSKTAQSTWPSTYCLIFAYEEPEPGLHRLYANLTPSEASKIQNILRWLTEHGDGGEYLASWIMQQAEEEPTQLFDYDGIVEEIKVQSRYNETNTDGEFYGGPCPLLM